MVGNDPAHGEPWVLAYRKWELCPTISPQPWVRVPHPLTRLKTFCARVLFNPGRGYLPATACTIIFMMFNHDLI